MHIGTGEEDWLWDDIQGLHLAPLAGVEIVPRDPRQRSAEGAGLGNTREYEATQGKDTISNYDRLSRILPNGLLRTLVSFCGIAVHWMKSTRSEPHASLIFLTYKRGTVRAATSMDDNVNALAILLHMLCSPVA